MRGRWFAATLWPYGAARRRHHPTAAPRRRPRGVRPDGRGPGPRHRGTGHRPRGHRRRLAAAQLRPRHARGRCHRPRGGSSPTRRSRTAGTRMRRAARVARSRDRDVAGGWTQARRVVRVVRWSGCRCRRAALATGCSSGLATTSPGRPGCSSCRRGAVIAPQPLPPGYAVRELCAGRGAGRVPGSSRTPSTSGRTGHRRRTRTGRPGVVRRPGFEPWHLRLASDPGGEVVGWGTSSSAGTTATSSTLAVRRDQRGLGLARALLVDCFAVAREHGASRSELSTDSRTGALGLYERVGMRVTSTWVHRAIAL